MNAHVHPVFAQILNDIAGDLKAHNDSTTTRYQRQWHNPKSNGWEFYGESFETEAELLRSVDCKTMFYQTRIVSFEVNPNYRRKP